MAGKVSKIVYGGKTLIDLTADTVTAEQMLLGVTAHDKSGELVTGTCTYDADTSDATAQASEILAGKSAYVRGTKVNGTMPNRASATGTISAVSETYTIQQGYHDGGGKVSISPEEQAKIVASNIRDGVVILGVTGTMSGTEGAKAEAATATPTTEEQVILPGEGYNYLSQVTVAAIPYSESENSAGGKTVTIA